MAKELVISGGQHETRVALLEDDQLVEIYFQRANEYSLAGSIHKGRVTRVLPGMQSAFVDLGLERDTFLYVSDFFEENEEFEKVGEQREARRGGEGRPREERNRDEEGGRRGRRGRDRGRDGGRRGARGPEAGEEAPRESNENGEVLRAEAEAPEVEVVSELENAAPESPSGSLSGEGRGRRRRRGRGPKNGNFPESKYADPAEAASEEERVEVEAAEEESEPEILLLPGEKLSKLKGRVEEPEAEIAEEEVAAAAEDAVAGEAELNSYEDENDGPAIVVTEHQVVAESKITPVHVISAETLKAEEEAAVLEEVKEHLAEIERENEELRDFEEAERIGLEEDEEEAEEAEEGAEVEVVAESTGEAAELVAESAGEGEEAEGAAEGEEDSSVVLPALGYSAHLQNRGDNRERGGRRRRRSRGGRDREASTGAAGAAMAPESGVETAEGDVPVSAEEAVATEALLPGEKRSERREVAREGAREGGREGRREGRRDDRREDRRDDRREERRERGERPERRRCRRLPNC